MFEYNDENYEIVLNGITYLVNRYDASCLDEAITIAETRHMQEFNNCYSYCSDEVVTPNETEYYCQ